MKFTSSLFTTLFLTGILAVPAFAQVDYLDIIEILEMEAAERPKICGCETPIMGEGCTATFTAANCASPTFACDGQCTYTVQCPRGTTPTSWQNQETKLNCGKV